MQWRAVIHVRVEWCHARRRTSATGPPKEPMTEISMSVDTAAAPWAINKLCSWTSPLEGPPWFGELAEISLVPGRWGHGWCEWGWGHVVVNLPIGMIQPPWRGFTWGYILMFWTRSNAVDKGTWRGVICCKRSILALLDNFWELQLKIIDTTPFFICSLCHGH